MLLDSLLQAPVQPAESMEGGCLLSAMEASSGTDAAQSSPKPSLVLMMAHHDFFCIPLEAIALNLSNSKQGMGAKAQRLHLVDA